MNYPTANQRDLNKAHDLAAQRAQSAALTAKCRAEFKPLLPQYEALLNAQNQARNDGGCKA